MDRHGGQIGLGVGQQLGVLLQPRRAACSLSCNSVMRWRSGSSSRSSCMRRSSLARSLAVRSSYSLRCAPRACSRSSFSAQRAPAGRPARRRRSGGSVLPGALLLGVHVGCGLLAAVSMVRASSARRACRLRWEGGLLRLALQRALLLAASASLRSASITRSSSWAWRSCVSASCMSSSSKRASAVTRRSCSRLPAGHRPRPGRRQSARCARGSARPAASGAGFDLQLVGAAAGLAASRGAAAPGAAGIGCRRPRP
jgi:hypothetical protein